MERALYKLIADTCAAKWPKKIKFMLLFFRPFHTLTSRQAEILVVGWHA